MTTLRRLTLCLLLAGSMSVTACGDDEDVGGEAGSGGSSGSGGQGGTGGGTGGTSGNDGGTSGTGGSGGTGGAGAGGSGGTGGADAGDDNDASMDEDGGTELEEHTATAALEPIEDNTITGTATFTTDGADVVLEVQLSDCPDGSYPVHIHEGTDCTNFGPHWDPPRGEGIPNIVCEDDEGDTMHIRMAANPKPWSIGLDNEETDVHGHTIVVHLPDDSPAACGEITLDD